jgi:hypothetical protein
MSGFVRNERSGRAAGECDETLRREFDWNTECEQ